MIKRNYYNKWNAAPPNSGLLLQKELPTENANQIPRMTKARTKKYSLHLSIYKQLPANFQTMINYDHLFTIFPQDSWQEYRIFTGQS